MWQQHAATALQGISGVHRGKAISVQPDGVILVAAEDHLPELIACRPLRTGAVTPTIGEGDSVIYLTPEEDPAAGYILGVIDNGENAGREPSSVETREAIHEERARLVLEGKDEVVLRTGRATIVLRSNGEIEIRGRKIVSRAGELQKLSAPMLKLN